MLYYSACYFSYIDLFSCAVYIKTRSDVFVTILESSNVLPLIQTPSWIVYSMRSSAHFTSVDQNIPPFHVYMDENSSRLAKWRPAAWKNRHMSERFFQMLVYILLIQLITNSHYLNCIRRSFISHVSRQALCNGCVVSIPYTLKKECYNNGVWHFTRPPLTTWITW